MYFVENLTLRNWLFSVLPRLFWERMSRGSKTDRCYVFDNSNFTLLVARAAARIVGVRVEKLRFRLMDVRDEGDQHIWSTVASQDLAKVQRDAMREAVFRYFIRGNPGKTRFLTYLAKSIAAKSLTDRQTIWRALLVVQICMWKLREEGSGGDGVVLFLERRAWFGAIKRYGSSQGVQIVPVNPSLSFEPRDVIRRILGPEGVAAARAARDRMLRWRRVMDRNIFPISRRSTAACNAHSKARNPSTPRVAAEFMEQLNLTRPECQSELFFWQQSSISGSDLFVLLHRRPEFLDEQWLEKQGVAMLALNPHASPNRSVPVFRPIGSPKRILAERLELGVISKSIEAKWLKEQITQYRVLYAYWSNLFSVGNVKVFITWYRYDAAHCAIADALQDLGGITAVYQRAYQPYPSAETTTDADIMFGYSQADAEVERRSNSCIKYHVAVGFLGDHRFALLRARAQELKYRLRKQGAKHILTFFDENSSDDSRWHTGHDLQREHYAFLLEKVLAHSWLGLVVKPKVSSTLRQRLGPVAELLQRAEKTGRCYVFEGGAPRNMYPPVVAALASDLAIHGHLCAGTAALEAALAGVPTLLMDREGWPASPLYRLGIGRVVFTDWDALWEACVRHWSTPAGIQGFGDWSPLLGEIDPFQDGRAAERMGTYIKWLIEGFKAGLDRESVMGDAAERYCKQWGWDKVTEVNGRPKLVSAA